MYYFYAFAVSLLVASAQGLTPREIFYGQNRSSKIEVVKPKPKSEAPVKVVNAAEIIRPLGLKYIIFKYNENGEYTQVDPDSTFVNGDQIRLTIETNDSGYLYVVTQGTSHLWKPLFPSSEIDGGNNRVERGKQYNIPNDSVFSFSGAAGAEKLFVILSRQPEGDIRNLMYKLEDRSHENTTLAANIDIQDSLVQRLRTTYARDLIIEKMDNTKSHASERVPTQEKAVYVVNPKGGDKAWVVADINLRHE